MRLMASATASITATIIIHTTPITILTLTLRRQVAIIATMTTIAHTRTTTITRTMDRTVTRTRSMGPTVTRIRPTDTTITPTAITTTITHLTATITRPQSP